MTRFPVMVFLSVLLGAGCLACGGCEGDGEGKSAGGPSAGKAAAPVERKDLVARKGEPLTVLGAQPDVGDPAPSFTAVDNEMKTYTFKPAHGRVYVLSAVPSLDTPTCSTETKRFNDETAELGEGVSVLTVSMDLPFAQKRWCGAEGVENVTTLSDSRDRAFGNAYGLHIKENGLLARAVFVVGKDGKITYKQVVSEITQEPDYDPILAAAREAAAEG